jgi:hypothetical protein
MFGVNLRKSVYKPFKIVVNLLKSVYTIYHTIPSILESSGKKRRGKTEGILPSRSLSYIPGYWGGGGRSGGTVYC